MWEPRPAHELHDTLRHSGISAARAAPVPPPLRENAGTDDSVPRRPPFPAEAPSPLAPRGRSRLSPVFSPPERTLRLSRVDVFASTPRKRGDRRLRPKAPTVSRGSTESLSAAWTEPSVPDVFAPGAYLTLVPRAVFSPPERTLRLSRVQSFRPRPASTTRPRRLKLLAPSLAPDVPAVPRAPRGRRSGRTKVKRNPARCAD
jgi:hypothetical protein